MRNPGANTVDEFLQSLGEYSHFLSGPAFAYSGESRQGPDVSEEYPRIIMYRGNTIIAITGKPVEKGGHEELFQGIEVIEFNPSRNAFEFHHVDFTKKGPKCLKAIRNPAAIATVKTPVRFGRLTRTLARFFWI
ncbi:MAG: hypothetical protein R3B54_02820 [Bdellovibrionota bacterium]